MASKRFRQAAEQVNRTTTYSLEDAVKLLKTLPGAKFDESVELSAALSVATKKGEQVLRGTVNLPHGTGRVRRVLVFCKGEDETAAKESGADFVGGAELMEKVRGGWLEFDVVVATPDMMRDVSRLGKVLGPRGLMPNPKTGTVTTDVAKAVREVKQGKIEFKMDKLANIHLVIGKRSFGPEQLVENGRTAIGAIARIKPTTAKGCFIRRVTLSSTMGPGLSVNTAGFEGAAA